MWCGQDTHTRTHARPFNGPLSRTTRVSWYQKGKTNLDFTKARDSEWQWHQLGHMQVCTSLQTDNHASTPSLRFLQAGCSHASQVMSATQPTASKHWRQLSVVGKMLPENPRRIIFCHTLSVCLQTYLCNSTSKLYQLFVHVIYDRVWSYSGSIA